MSERPLVDGLVDATGMVVLPLSVRQSLQLPCHLVFLPNGLGGWVMRDSRGLQYDYAEDDNAEADGSEELCPPPRDAGAVALATLAAEVADLRRQIADPRIVLYCSVCGQHLPRQRFAGHEASRDKCVGGKL